MFSVRCIRTAELTNFTGVLRETSLNSQSQNLNVNSNKLIIDREGEGTFK